MLYQAVAECGLKSALKSREAYRPFPLYGDRAAWSAVSDEVKAYYSGVVRGLAGKELLDPLRATRYMDFMRNGNRTRYQDVHFPRRSNVTALMLAECMAGDGALIDEIIDLVWAICEETSWVLPAHVIYSAKPQDNLPDIEAPVYIDLFAAETGSALTWVHYFLGEEIAKRAPLVTRRIELEVKRRILDPFLEDDRYSWKGLAHSDPVNNWNPWINSNILTAFLVLEPDENRRVQGVLHTAKSIQRFLDFYYPDGGCDEGPSYFNAAGGSLFDYLEEIGYATGGAVDIYGDPMIQNIAKYIYRVHVGGAYYVNFADAPPRVSVNTGLLRRVGEKIGDKTLVEFSNYMQANGFARKEYASAHNMVYRLIGNALGFTPFDAAKYVAPRDHMFDGIQVMTARKQADSWDGLFVAFKGGHNDESHNHNDVGSYVLYVDGKPVVIDAGVETYTRKTFSKDRYEIWTMCSNYHNLPDINGCTQFPGRAAQASDVQYTIQGDVSEMSLDIAGAYPKEAAVNRFVRCLRYDRGNDAVTLRDEYELEKAIVPVVNHLICYAKPAITQPGMIDLGGLTLAYDAATFEIEIEAIPLTDPQLRTVWAKEELFRINLTAKSMDKKNDYTFTFAR